ncbi:MAG: type IV pilus twitching motility protein PilT [Acidiferrobacterales bacterium]
MRFSEWFLQWVERPHEDYSDLRLTEGMTLMGRASNMRNEPVPDSPTIIESDFTNLFERRDLAPKALDLDFSATFGGHRFRVNIYRRREKLAANLRPLREQSPDLEALGLPADTMRKQIDHGQGLIILTGPTGSGKTTSIVALLMELARTRGVHIVTVEDPIEYLLPEKVQAKDGGVSTIHQREVGTDTETFRTALRSALRQNPDAISIGEVRDEETAAIAIRAALTGHLVFATLHTPTAPQAVSRLVDFFETARRQSICADLADALVMVVGQTLVAGKAGASRVLVYEIMTMNGGIKDQIRKGKLEQIFNEMNQGGAYGMITRDKTLTKLVSNGKISTDDALRYATSDTSREEIKNAAAGRA